MKTKMVKLMLAAGAIGILLLIAGCSGSFWIGLVPVPNESPVAFFTAAPSTGVAPLWVQFDAGASFDPDGTIVSYQWNFGDNTTGSGPSPTNTYRDDSDQNNDGVDEGYTVTLVVRDDDGASAFYEMKVYVSNPRPVAHFTVFPQSVLTGKVVCFNPEASYDPAAVEVETKVETNPEGIGPGPTTGRIVSWQWNFGDGTTGSGPSPTHVYEDDSDQNKDGYNEGFTVTLVVTDDDGAQSIPFSQVVWVWNRPPVAVIVWRPCPVANHAKAMRLKGIVPDPPSPPGPPDVCLELSAEFSTDPDGDIVDYRWYYQGEPFASEQKVLVSVTPGIGYEITLRVTDDDGATSIATDIITP